MIAQELEVILHRAFLGAREMRHELITVEHLLLALLGSQAVASVLRACGADAVALRGALTGHVNKTSQAPADRDFDTQPTLAFQRVIQRAILKVQSSGNKEVGSADVLLAIVAEQTSQAAELLKQHAVTYQAVLGSVVPGPAGKPEAKDLGDATELQVVLYNDDYTPMEFVVRVLQEFFGMDAENAKEAMLEVHREGVAVCGLYSREDGLALVGQVMAFARENGHPLVCEAVVPKP